MLALAASPDRDHHDTGTGHPERPERVKAALAGIQEAGLADAVKALEPRPATIEELTRAHKLSYLEAVHAFCESGGGALDPDTVVSPGSWDTALLAAGGTLAALEELKVGKAELGLVLARPPGHHASADTAMGFCLINNVAVAAASLADQGERVLILDWDVHHGNGTQAIFYNDPRVLYVSTHQAPFYPGTGGLGEIGGPQASGLTVNLPLPAGATGDIVAKVLDEVATPVIERFAPTWVVVSAGFDGHRDDPLADLALTAGDFADLATRARGFAPAPGRLLIVLEGGYDLNALKHSMAATLSAALGENYRPEPSSSGGPGADHIEAARRVHAVQLS